MSGAVYTNNKAALIVITIVFICLVLVDLIGNSLVIAVIVIHKSMRTPINYLLINLAVADMLVAVFMSARFIFSPFITHPDGLAGTMVCKFLTGGSFTWTTGHVSVFLLVAVCLERYFAIVHPYSMKFRLNSKKAKIIALVCWVSSAIFNIPDFLLISYDKKNNFCMEWWPDHLEALAHSYSLVCLVVIGILPSTTMIVLYSRVVYKLWFKDEIEGTQLAVRNSRKRITKMVIIISIIYGLTWLPNQTIYALVHYLPGYTYGDVTYIVSIILVTCNSAINPFIYSLQSRNFRHHMWKILSCRQLRKITVDTSANSTNMNTLTRDRIDNKNTAQQV